VLADRADDEEDGVGAGAVGCGRCGIGGEKDIYRSIVEAGGGCGTLAPGDRCQRSLSSSYTRRSGLGPAEGRTAWTPAPSDNVSSRTEWSAWSTKTTKDNTSLMRMGRWSAVSGSFRRTMRFSWTRCLAPRNQLRGVLNAVTSDPGRELE
jgi:hypothetical protein